MFIEAFYDACAELLQKGFSLPNLDRVNRVLLETDAGYEISSGGDLLARNPQLQITVPTRAPSHDEKMQETIQSSLRDSEKFLLQGHGRQAVQEVLWLLETVSIAFCGLDTTEGTIKGKYFTE